MLKRIFWLAFAAAAGWLLWNLWRQRREESIATAPLLAPLEPYRHSDAPPRTQPPPAAPPPAVEALEPRPAPDVTTAAAPPAVLTSQPDTTNADKLGEVIGYCPRCKTKRSISNAHEETTESGRRAARGICPVCGGNMFTFLPNK